jgi:hypothetical protein
MQGCHSPTVLLCPYHMIYLLLSPSSSSLASSRLQPYLHNVGCRDRVFVSEFPVDAKPDILSYPHRCDLKCKSINQARACEE